MAYTNEELDTLLTVIRKSYEKTSYDEDNDDDLHDGEKAPAEFYEGVWDVLDDIRKNLNIPETNKSEYKPDDEDEDEE